MSLLKLLLFGDPHHRSADQGWTSYNIQRGTQTLAWIQNAFDSAAARGFVSHKKASVGDNSTAANAGEKTSLLDGVIALLDFAVLGNHDFEYATQAEVRARLLARGYTYLRPLDGTAEPYLYGSFDADGYHFVILDPNYYDTGTHVSVDGTQGHGYIPQAELDWLAADLAATSLPVLVFTHHSLNEWDGSTFYTSPTSDFDRYATTNRAEAREVLEASGKVQTVFQGHQHFARHSVIAGIPYIDLPSLVGVHPFPTRLLAGDKGIWAEVTIDDVAQTITYQVYEDDSTAGVRLASEHVIPYGASSPYLANLGYNKGALTPWTVTTATVDGVPQDIVLTNARATDPLPSGLLVQGGATVQAGTASIAIPSHTGDFAVSVELVKAETDKTLNVSLLTYGSTAIGIVFNASGQIVCGGQSRAYTPGQTYTVLAQADVTANTATVSVDGTPLATDLAASAPLSGADALQAQWPAGQNGTALLGEIIVTGTAGIPEIDCTPSYSLAYANQAVGSLVTSGTYRLTGFAGLHGFTVLSGTGQFRLSDDEGETWTTWGTSDTVPPGLLVQFRDTAPALPNQSKETVFYLWSEGEVRFTVSSPDTIAPTTTCDRASGTYPAGTTVTLSEVGPPYDVSQPVTIEYRFNGGEAQTYSEPFALTTFGTFEFRGTDALGNTEDWNALAFANGTVTSSGGYATGGEPVWSIHVASDLEIPFDIWTTVLQSLGMAYDLAGSVVSSLQAKFDILNSVSTNLELVYDLRLYASSDVELVFDVRGWSQSQLQAVYDMAGSVFSPLEIRYDIQGGRLRVSILGSSFTRFLQ
jgi:hypothetical protein